MTRQEAPTPGPCPSALCPDVVVHLNGTEVARSTMPPGAVTAATPASTAVAGAQEQQWFDVPVSPGLLRTGTDVLAVEVHQSGASSSQVSFAASLSRSSPTG